MSMYAMPGLFPAPSFASTRCREASSPLTAFHKAPPLSVSTTKKTTNEDSPRPLGNLLQLLDKNTLAPNNNKDNKPTLLFAFNKEHDNVAVLKKPTTVSMKKKETVDISISGANVDTIKWIQSLTTTPSLRNLRRRPRPDGQKDAIQFDLSIRWNNERYFATKRTFARIEQLRTELCQEVASSSSSSQIIDIPELPNLQKLQQDCCGKNNALAGFTMLQAWVEKHLGPLVEEWFQQVLSLSMSSPALKHFLLMGNNNEGNHQRETNKDNKKESNKTTTKTNGSRLMKKRNRFITCCQILGSIEEEEDSDFDPAEDSDASTALIDWDDESI